MIGAETLMFLVALVVVFQLLGTIIGSQYDNTVNTIILFQVGAGIIGMIIFWFLYVMLS